MIQDLKVFVIFSVFSLAAYVLARMVFGRGGIEGPQLVVYLGLMLIAILTRNIYLVFAYLFIVKVVYLKNDLQRNILFFIFLYPLLPIGVVQPFLSPGTAYFIDLNLQRVLSLLFLLPLLGPIRRLAQEKPDMYKVDFLFLCLALIFMVSFFRENSLYQVTVFFGIREAMGFILDVVIPYFVLSRALQTFSQLTSFARSLVFGGFIVAMASIVEAGLGWKFYFDVAFSLSDYMTASFEKMYEFRGGILRVSASLGHPITLGFFMTMVLGFSLFLFVQFKTNFAKRLLVLIPICLVIFATGSRGAWLGAFILLSSYVFYSLSRGMRKLLLVQFVIFGIAAGLMYSNPGAFDSGSDLNSLDTHGTFEYRAKLAETALTVIPENLLWGTRTYRDNPKMQELVQGQGIIDMVNGYVAIAIEYGMVTLMLFFLMLVRALTVGGKWVSLGDDYQYDAYRYLGAAIITVILSFALQFTFTSFNGFVYNYIWLIFAIAKGFNYVYGNTVDEIFANDGVVQEQVNGELDGWDEQLDRV